MSKQTMSLPCKKIGSYLVGGLVALGAYALLQLPVSFLVHREVIEEGAIGAAICISASLASFLGCGYSVLKGEKGTALSAAAVTAVFLTLAAAVGACLGDRTAVGPVLTEVGIAMVFGGLAAAVAGGFKKGGGDRRNKRSALSKRR